MSYILGTAILDTDEAMIGYICGNIQATIDSAKSENEKLENIEGLIKDVGVCMELSKY